MSESELLQCVLDLAAVLGWRTAHFRPARSAKGWRTAVQGDGKGFPDLVLVPPYDMDRLVEFWELKDEHAQLSPDQKAWRDRLTENTCVVWRLVRPSHWVSGEVAQWLA